MFSKRREREMGKVKALNGRAPTEADVEAGTVVFYIPDSRSTPYEFDHQLPLLARVINPDDGAAPLGSIVTIVQAEKGDNGQVLLGLLLDDGGEAVCMLEEVELIGPAPKDRPTSI
jgi:hypothetical protein